MKLKIRYIKQRLWGEPVSKLSDAQRGKIFKLAAEKGLDNEMLHAYIFSLVGKSSIKELSKRDAMTIIDALIGKTQNAIHMISNKQQKYIEGLAKNYGWVDENNNLNRKKLSAWLEGKYGCSDITWLTSKKASDAIEGLKAMISREKANQKTADSLPCAT